MTLQTIQAGTSGDVIPITCQKTNPDGSISPIDFTGATALSVQVIGPSGTTSYTPVVVAAAGGQIELITVVTMFLIPPVHLTPPNFTPAASTQVEYQIQVVATLANGNVYRSPRGVLLVLP